MKTEPPFIQERTLWRRVRRRVFSDSARPSAPPPDGPINLGLIGAGNVAQWQHLPCIRDNPDRFRLVAVCDVNIERAAHVASVFNARVCGTVRELVDAPDVAAVLVCTPTPRHAEGVLAAIRARKHVLVEKPMGTDVNDAQFQWNAARLAKGAVHMVNFNFRFRPDFALIRQIVRSGTIGELYQLSGTLAQGRWYSANGTPSTERPDAALWKFDAGGVLLDLGPHLLDLARWWAGEIVRVQAWAKALPAKPESIATSGIGLTFANGAVGQLLTSRLATGTKEQSAFELSGSLGAVRYQEGRVELWTREVPRWRELLVPPAETTALDTFYRAIVRQPVQVPSFWDGYKNNELLTAILQSAEAGTFVSLPLAADEESAESEMTYPLTEREAAGRLVLQKA